MAESLYFLFLDEIYAPNLNEMLRITKKELSEHKTHKHFGIGGAIVPAGYIQDIAFRLDRITKKYYPAKKNFILHYVDILNARDNFSDLAIDNDKKKKLCLSISALCRESKYNYDYVFVDKHNFLKTYGIFDSSGKVTKIRKIKSNMFPLSAAKDYNLYLLCLKQLVRNFYAFLTSKNMGARGIIVAEARGEKEDSELREAFHTLHCNGVGSIKPSDLRGMVIDIFIVPKKQNYPGTQLADSLLYPTYDATIPDHNIRTDHFVDYDRDIRKKVINKGNHLLP